MQSTDIDNIMMHVIQYGETAALYQKVVLLNLYADDHERLKATMDDKFNEIMTLIKISQQDAVIKELKLAIDNLSKEQANGN